WTQVLDVVEYMSDATSIPILLDGDTGYGNFNNMRRLVKKLCQRDAGGVCIEDKIFPKTNSFLRGERQPLADIDEFCGKIKAGKDSQLDDDFVIVARVEAFIAGWGLKAALERAEAYRLAGADAILMHSKLANSSEIFSFLKEWDNRAPVVLVPTKYYVTPTNDFRQHNVSLVIWANHLIRGKIAKMQEIARQIHSDENLLNVEDMIVPVKEIFRLQDDQEIAEAEKRYLSQEATNPFKAIILAATRGKALGHLTGDIPKTMLKIGKKSILERIVSQLNEREIKNITVVAGYKADAIDLPNLNIVVNDQYETAGQLVSLSKAADQLDQSSLIIFGDILFKKYILLFAIEDPTDVVIIVDSKIDPESTIQSDYVIATEPDRQSYFAEESYVEQIAFTTPAKNHTGEFIGVLKLSPRAGQMTQQFIQSKQQEPGFETLDIRDLINHFIQEGVKVKIQYISGHWVDVNRISDLTLANEFSS
ncbi:MAG: isocitrate lyase/phosphoenolpyruvate mutase family protein, partial [SAR324 cluster bacterium]|nr:isocitrate lyase/phosphoenolpyruvate mutase family protein [SAR324 cluster bacterium]